MGKVIYKFHRLVRLQKALQSAAASAEIRNSHFADEDLLEKLLSQDWWRQLIRMLAYLWPLHHLLRMTDFDKPIVGYVYPYIRDFLQYLKERGGNDDEMMERGEDFDDDEGAAKAIYRLANERLGDWCGDLHLAAYFINPFYFAEVYNSKENSAVILQRMMTNVWFHLRIEDRDSKICAALDQWASYKTKSGPLHSIDMAYAWRAAKANNKPPAHWWRVYGAGAPDLMEFAVAVLSQFVTAAATERGWQRHKVPVYFQNAYA
jgi:hypothetical protein